MARGKQRHGMQMMTVDIPDDLYRQYRRVCQIKGVTVSDDIRSFVKARVEEGRRQHAPLMQHGLAQLVLPQATSEPVRDQSTILIQMVSTMVELLQAHLARSAAQPVFSVERPVISPNTGGYVYVLKADGHGYCKIGRTINPDSRFAQLQAALPWPVKCEYLIPADNSVAAEEHLHRLFAHRRTNGEWFALSEPELSWLKSLTALCAPYPVLAGVEELEKMMEGE